MHLSILPGAVKRSVPALAAFALVLSVVAPVSAAPTPTPAHTAVGKNPKVHPLVANPPKVGSKHKDVNGNTVTTVDILPLSSRGWTSPTTGVSNGPMPYHAANIDSSGTSCTDIWGNGNQPFSTWPYTVSEIELDYTFILPSAEVDNIVASVSAAGDDKIVINDETVLPYAGTDSACGYWNYSGDRSVDVSSVMGPGSNTIQVFGKCGTYCADRWINFAMSADGTMTENPYSTEGTFSDLIATEQPGGGFTYALLNCTMNTALDITDMRVGLPSYSVWAGSTVYEGSDTTCTNFPVGTTQSAFGQFLLPSGGPVTSLPTVCGASSFCDVIWDEFFKQTGDYVNRYTANVFELSTYQHFVTASISASGVTCDTPVTNGHSLVCLMDLDFTLPTP